MKLSTRALCDVADLTLGKMLDEKKNRGEPLPYLANINVRWGEFDLRNLREMRFKEEEKERFGLRSGDIVMCEGGEPGRCAIWKDDMPGMMFQKALHRIRPHGILDNQYLFYFFLHTGRIGGFTGLFTGSTIKHLPAQQLAKLAIQYPERSVQRRIAGILTAYDDLLANNRQRMALLEESARLLYREWFVNLRFSGHKLARLSKGIPNGWRKTPLGDITTKIGSGATPRGGEAAYRTEGVTLIRSMNVYNDRFDDDGLAFIDEEQAAELENVSVQPRDILLNITGASVSRCCMAPERHLPARVNQHVMIIRTDPVKADPFFVQAAINSDERKRQLLSYAQKGSTREALTKEVISAFEITLPPKGLMHQFGEIAGPCFSQRETLALQNQKLRAARDHLLPRLISGEIEV